MSQNTRKIAVLTGDLVNSTGLGPEKVERAFRALEDCAEMQAEWMGGQSLHFTRHRGDGWQVALMEPKYALRSALCFRAALRALGEEFDSYIGMAEGETEGEIGPDLNAETVSVFIKSGEALEDLKTTPEVSMCYIDPGIYDALTISLDYISNKWTPSQAQAIIHTLSPGNDLIFTEIAEKLGKSRQAVSKSLRAAGLAHIELILETIDRDVRFNA
ncbi:MarR family transcriptional regulator [Celeribacter neptunius]|uniref:SatD family (SatD) n=1 Tax=Celeribacter neptunius TaxID=588602 RepID=A0A1I3KYS8_9RHOB|nr:MarR family transcriptional regulator [Celeribacter neptunius]SFI77570.1 hypothetical protein SAMN04487991_0837 [Celeribacter neptunius]